MQFRKGCRLWWIAALAAALDRITKVWASQALRASGTRTVVPGVLSFAYAENRGMAFSMLSGRTLLLSLATLAIIAVVVVWLLRDPAMPKLQRAGLWLIAGGGIGNLYDRALYGYVVDFIRPDFINFAVFNLADVFVCVGAGLVLLAAVILETRKGKPHG